MRVANSLRARLFLPAMRSMVLAYLVGTGFFTLAIFLRGGLA